MTFEISDEDVRVLLDAFDDVLKAKRDHLLRDLMQKRWPRPDGLTRLKYGTHDAAVQRISLLLINLRRRPGGIMRDQR